MRGGSERGRRDLFLKLPVCLDDAYSSDIPTLSNVNGAFSLKSILAPLSSI